MYRWRGKAYRRPRHNGIDASSAAGLSGAAAGLFGPDRSPSKHGHSTTPGGGSRPGRFFPNYQGEPARYQPAMPPLRGGPVGVGGGGWAAGAAAGMSAWAAFLLGGAALIYGSYKLGQAAGVYFRTNGTGWALRMYGYELITNCRPASVMGSGGWIGCTAGYEFFTPWDGTTRPSIIFGYDQAYDYGAPGATWEGRRAQRWSRVIPTTPARSRTLLQPWWDPWDPDNPDPWIYPEPWPNPNVDPASAPIAQPAPAPEPMPWPVIPDLMPNPFRSPDAQPQRGPQPKPQRKKKHYRYSPHAQPQPQPQPQPSPLPQPLPPSRPVEPAAPPVPPHPPISVGQGPFVPPPYRQQPPKPREKERKFNTPYPRIAMMIINAASEMGDLVDDIWWALPGKYRSPPIWHPDGYWYQVGAGQKMRDIYNNFDKVDQEKMWDNIVNSIGEDMFFGIIGQQLGKANRAAWNAGFASDRAGFGMGAGPAL